MEKERITLHQKIQTLVDETIEKVEEKGEHFIHVPHQTAFFVYIDRIISRIQEKGFVVKRLDSGTSLEHEAVLLVHDPFPEDL